MMSTRIDHLVVTAPSLEIGARYVSQELGVLPQPGGEHERMGTHNLLLRVGDRIYLEVIARNPSARPPNRARWFDLDRLDANAAPRLTTWVARTGDIRRLARVAPFMGAPIQSMSRGELKWRIAFPEDGRLILDGLCPYLIQWSSDDHPAQRLPELGVNLIALEVLHPEPDRILGLWQALEIADLVPVTRGASSRLVARFETPKGHVTLCTVPEP